MKRLWLMIVLTAAVAGLVFAGGRGQGSGGGGKVTLQAAYYDAGRQNEYDTLYGLFSKKYPNITIECISNLSEYRASMMAMIQSGTMPDLVMGQYTDLYDLGSNGHLIDLTTEPFIANFPDFIRKQMVEPDGKIYGIPHNLAAMGIFYNQEMFEKTGIKEFPKTVSALQDACNTLKAAGFTPFSIANEPWVLGQMFGVMVSSVQPDVQDFSVQLKNNPRADRKMKEMLYGIKAIDIQFNNAISTAKSNDYGTFLNDFASGKVAMIQMGTWAIRSILDLGPQFTMRYGAVPYSENPRDVRLSANIGVSYAIGAQTKHKAEALKLFEWLSSVEGNTEFGRLFGEIPVIPGVQFTYTPCTQDVKNFIDSEAICPWGQIFMSSAGWAEGDPIMQSYYLGEATAEETINKWYDAWYK
ncbi:MAG: extracellular solute-binding protein [Treponema sp.]|jgi:raffinose/stachyose/melibiose transport system substrate-binding protein|nr:extracellular solute-binding protein [Treponema sp.]